jgi:hypothetical protein
LTLKAWTHYRQAWVSGLAFSFLQFHSRLFIGEYRGDRSRQALSEQGEHMKFELSRHARQELQRRSVPIKLLESVLNNPQQIIQQPDGKKVYQSQLDFGDGKIFLLRPLLSN